MDKIKRLYEKVNKSISHLEFTNQTNSEFAVIETVVRPILEFSLEELGLEFNPLTVTFYSNANSDAQPDFVLCSKVIVEAKNVNETKQNERLTKLNFDKTGKNKSEYHLSQAVYYLSRLRREKELPLKHIVVTTGKRWIMVNDVVRQIQTFYGEKLEDLKEELFRLNGKPLFLKDYKINDFTDFVCIVNTLKTFLVEK